jgi:hypothetical protein
VRRTNHWSDWQENDRETAVSMRVIARETADAAE